MEEKTIGENFTMSMAELAYLSKGLSTISKVFEYPPQRDASNNWHPTSKPVKLYEWIYLNYAKEGMKIIDTHLGSASSAIAAYNVNMNLDFTGIEIDEEYFNNAVKRVREQTMQQMLF
jgi:DNA modification methylase